jgi:hypothetical protein
MTLPDPYGRQILRDKYYLKLLPAIFWNNVYEQEQGEALNEVAKKTVKVVVGGNPCNTNALICAKFAPSIPKENFTALTRLDQNRSVAYLAKYLHVDIPDISKVCMFTIFKVIVNNSFVYNH